MVPVPSSAIGRRAEGRWEVGKILGNIIIVLSFVVRELVGKPLHVTLGLAETQQGLLGPATFQ